MTEKDVQKQIIKKYTETYHHKICVPNIYFFDWESDVLSVSKDNMIYNFEIKVSRFDYLQESKKIEKIDSMKRLVGTFPNFHYFVGPEEILMDLEIPEYAGLIVISQNGMTKYMKEVKTANMLHDQPIDPKGWEELACKLFNKFI